MPELCDNFPDWQGCECTQEKGHDGPHECVCGAQWDDGGRMLRRGYQGREGTAEDA